MPDEEGRPVRGEVGHWRYNKDTAAGNKFDEKGVLIQIGPPENPPKGKDTSTKTTGLKLQGKKGTPDPKGVYTEAVARGFNKVEQRNLLKARDVQITSGANEKELVDLILKSNPGGELSKIPSAPVPTEEQGTAKTFYTQEELEDFKSRKLVEILKGLGAKIPLTEKGKIEKILELQK